MRVVALFRVSTEKQESEGASLDAQQRAYRSLAERSGWRTVAEFRGCESATQAATDRRVLQEVLACIREHAPDAIYVHEQSRLTRGDELEVALLLRELREQRLKIIVGGVVRDLSSIDERFMVGIQSLVDRAESERIKERMIRGKRERARQGKKSTGPAPFGYTNPAPGTPGRGTLQVVPEEAAIVRRLFALAASGIADRAVAIALNAAGLKAPRGGRWGRSTVVRILNNPAYLGTSAAGVWKAQRGSRTFRFNLAAEGAILVENAHEAIIDRVTWDAIHRRAKLPRAAKPRMLAGLLWVNGRHCQGDSSRHGAYYRAARGIKGAPWLGSDLTDAAVWDAFASLATSPEFVERMMAEARNPREQLVISQEIEYLEDRIGKNQRRLENLLNMRADGEIDKPTFQAKSEEARKAIGAMQTELAALRAKVVTLDGTVAERVVRAVQVLLAGRTKLTADQRRAILRSIVRRVDVAVEPTGVLQTRGPRGHLAASGGPRWAIRTVSFRLALPPAQVPQEGTRGVLGPVAASGAGEPAGFRDGQLATTF